jgi:hypothetical protein
MATRKTPLLLLLAAACAPGAPPPSTPVPEPEAPRAPAPAPAAESRSWSFRYAAGARRYRVESEATVELRADTGSRRAPIRTTAIVTLAAQPSTTAGAPTPGGPSDVGALSVTVTVDSFAIQLGDAIPSAADTLPSRATFSATMTALGRLTTAIGDSGAACGPTAPLAAAAREVIVPVPATLEIGGRWSDSSSVTVCSGGTPVTVGTVRDYEVTGRETVDGTPAVRVRRTETFTLAGARRVAGRQIVITGRGTGEGTLHFDPAAGAYLGGRAESESELSVRVGADETAFTQRVRQEVRALR